MLSSSNCTVMLRSRRNNLESIFLQILIFLAVLVRGLEEVGFCQSGIENIEVVKFLI